MTDSPQLWTDFISLEPFYQELRDLKEHVCYKLLFRILKSNNRQRAGQMKPVIGFFRKKIELQ